MHNEKQVEELATRQPRRKHCGEIVDVLPKRPSIIADTLDLALSRKERIGRMSYGDSREELERFRADSFEFLDYIRSHNVLAMEKGSSSLTPSIESWAMSLGLSRKTISEYEKRGGEWERTIRGIKGAIYAVKWALADSGQLSPVTFLFDLTNNAGGYYNTSEFRVSMADQTTERPKMSIQQIRAAIGLNDESEEGAREDE